jgi:hypothetical protein
MKTNDRDVLAPKSIISETSELCKDILKAHHGKLVHSVERRIMSVEKACHTVWYVPFW